MIKYKLVNILKQLESLEWSSLRKYLLMHTRVESDNFRLFETLRQNITKLSTNEDVLSLHTKYFSQMKSKSYTNMLSRVSVWTENWIIHEEVKRDEHSSKTILLKYYNRKGLYKEADNTALKAEKALLNEKEESLAKYRHLSDVYHAQYYSNNPIKYKSGTELLQKIVDTRLEQYGSQLAAYKVELLNWGEIKNHDYSKEIRRINSNIIDIEDNPIIKSLELISTVFDTRMSNNLSIVYKNLKDGFFKSQTELELLVTSYLMSLSLRLLKESKLVNTALMKDIYEYSLESGILMISGKIPIVRWYNIVTVISSVASKIDAIHFINKWIDKTNSPNKSKSKKLSYATTSFYNKNYKEIYIHLKDVVFSSKKEKYRALSLKVIYYFKMRNMDYNKFIESHYNAVRTLKRNKTKLTKDDFIKYTNLFNVLLQISDRRFKISKKEFTLPKRIIYKKWLLNEISQINI